MNDRLSLDILLGFCDTKSQRKDTMDKATFIRTLTEERCDDFRLRLAMKTEGELKVTRIAPLEEDDVDLLVEFEGTPTNAQAGIDQAHEVRKLIEAELKVTLDFVEMVPRRSVRNGSVGFHSVLAWFRLS